MSQLNFLLFYSPSEAEEKKEEKMDTTPPADEKKGTKPFLLTHFYEQNCWSIFLYRFLFPDTLWSRPAAEPKEEKEAVKSEEATKLQNGDGSKESGATAAAAAAATAGATSEEKKKAKSRFMFNIADGGFTGTYTKKCKKLKQIIALFSFNNNHLLTQSFTPCGKTRSGLPPSPRRPTRSGTVVTTTGCWQASYSILFPWLLACCGGEAGCNGQLFTLDHF